MPLDLILISAGIVLLYYGGEHLVSGASNLARSYGVSHLVIGLTVIAFGTSAPELAASITAAVFRDSGEIALANVIGSNVANIGLILGVAGMVYPLRATAPFLKRELPFMISVSVLLIVIVALGALGRWAGALFLLLLVLYLWYLFQLGDEVPLDEIDSERAPPKPLWSSLRVALGISLLAIGARILVDGAIGVAVRFGISQRIVGLTLVAIGTSLPELATAVVAALKRESDLVLGNLIGSNIFNILCILGFTLVLHPLDIPFTAVSLDLWVMLAFSLSVVPLLWFRMRIGRKRSSLLLAAYFVYVVTLFF